MKILRAVKNNYSINSSFASLLISSLQVQILSMFLAKINPFNYGKIAQFMTFESSLDILVIINFILNFIQILSLSISAFVSKRNEGQKKIVNKSGFIRSLQIKHYITFVQIINFNTLAIESQNNLIKGFAILNILFVFFELYALKIVSISYRFVEKNFMRRRNSSIVPWVLIVPILISINYLPIIFACLLLLVRALTQLYNNFCDLQNETVRRLEYFYPLMSVLVAIIIFIDDLASLRLFSSTVFSGFVLGFSVFCCQSLTKTAEMEILRFKLKNSSQFFEDAVELQGSGNSESAQIDENKVNQNILQLRIMVNIFVSRAEYKSAKKTPLNSSSFHYDRWWTFFNQFIINHKIYCDKVNCVCHGFSFGKFTQNSAIEDQVMTQKVHQLIKKLQSQSSQSTDKKLKIIESYFLVEIQKKPFKGYYQLVKLFASPLTKSETLEVQTLLIETRDRFKIIFTKEKVRNSDLELEPVFELQNQIKEMRLQMNDMALNYRNFYEIFANNFIEMESLKARAKKISENKVKFSQRFEHCLEKFNKSLDLVTFAMVYFQFFDEYTDKLNIVEKKAMLLYQTYFRPKNLYKNKGVDVFDPNYGSVKIDLVFKIGKVISISKNLCHVLGFDHRQIEDHKVNKMMPHMFARFHDRFLRNFIEKGSLKMLKKKQSILYARKENKFIVPVSIRLKVDFSKFDNFCAMAFIKPTHTKSEFILLNNYGKIEQITEGLYRKLFINTRIEEISKIKKLSMSKMMLSLNHYLKDPKSKDETIHEGLLLTGQSSEVLIDYYRLPELGISLKKGDQSSSGNSSSRNSSNFSLEASSSPSSRHSSLDFSQDMSQYTLGMKEALKDYLKKLDVSKIIGYRVTYRLKDLVTSEFKCKVLQIISIREEESISDLNLSLQNQILDVAELFNLEQHQYQRFIKLPVMLLPSSTFFKQKMALKDNIQSSNQVQYQKQVQIFKDIKIQESQGSSVCSLTQVEKQKQNVISAFSSKTIVSKNLQTGLNLMILCTALLLVLISFFSIKLESNYIKLQHDNLIITNFRINFLANLGIYQLQKFYQTLQIDPPSFMKQKKTKIDEKMKLCLKKSTQWISLSHQYYQSQLILNYADKNYSENRSILQAIMIAYFTLLSNPSKSKYITENFVIFNDQFIALTYKQQSLITQTSLSYKTKIDIVVIFYSLIIIGIAIICFLLKKISIQNQNKIIDFLPFFKACSASKKVRFYDLFYQFNRQSENLDSNIVAQIEQNAQIQNLVKSNNQNGTRKLTKKKLKLGQESNSQLIKVVKNENRGLSPKIKLIGVLVFLLCAFVIFFSQYFFSETHSKFEAYLRLKNSAFLVQLIPARIILLYFININRALQGEPQIDPPVGFESLVHDRIFELQLDLSSQKLYGLETQITIRDHFNNNICNLIQCQYDAQESTQIYNQDLFYLTYRIINSFNYMRKIKDLLPTFADPKVQIQKWMRQNNMLEILKSTEFILDLMTKNQEEITQLFTNQIASIGQTLLAISITLIPILIVSLMLAKSKYMESISSKLESTENVYKHIGWEMLGENTYAVNYFEKKLKMTKTY